MVCCRLRGKATMSALGRGRGWIKYELVEVVLAQTAAAPLSGGSRPLYIRDEYSRRKRNIYGTHDRHLRGPTVIVTDGLQQTAAIVLQDASEEGGTSPDVVVLRHCEHEPAHASDLRLTTS